MTTFSFMTGILLFPRACKPQHCRKKMHNGHQDIRECCQCTASSVWRPGVSKHIEQLIKSCPNCAKASTLHRVTDVLITTPKSCMHGRTLDLFELNGSTYLLVVDYVCLMLQ